MKALAFLFCVVFAQMSLAQETIGYAGATSSASTRTVTLKNGEDFAHWEGDRCKEYQNHKGVPRSRFVDLQTVYEFKICDPPPNPVAAEAVDKVGMRAVVFGFGYPKELVSAVADYVEYDLKMTVPHDYNGTHGDTRETRESFMSIEGPTIFYYNGNEHKARDLARKLKEKFGIDFVIRTGPGNGVMDKDRDLMIHFVSKS